MNTILKPLTQLSEILSGGTPSKKIPEYWDGDIPWIWFCNVDHLYYVRDGLKVAEQKIHPHGHGWSIVNNVDQWEWSK